VFVMMRPWSVIEYPGRANPERQGTDKVHAVMQGPANLGTAARSSGRRQLCSDSFGKLKAFVDI
jgi:hypothetical protein